MQPMQDIKIYNYSERQGADVILQQEDFESVKWEFKGVVEAAEFAKDLRGLLEKYEIR